MAKKPNRHNAKLRGYQRAARSAAFFRLLKHTPLPFPELSDDAVQAALECKYPGWRVVHVGPYRKAQGEHRALYDFWCGKKKC